MSLQGVKRWSMECKATVKIGEFSRGGLTRGDHRASDHDMGCQEKYVPCGIVDAENGALHITFGSSYKTSDFIVDTIEAKWEAMAEQEKAETSLIQIKMDQWSREQRQAHAISLASGAARRPHPQADSAAGLSAVSQHI
jgi:hypothetical protein